MASTNQLNEFQEVLLKALSKATEEVKEKIENKSVEIGEEEFEKLQKRFKEEAPSDPRTRKNKLQNSFYFEKRYKKGMPYFVFLTKKQGNKVFLLEYGHKVGVVKNPKKKKWVEARPFYNKRKEETKNAFADRIKKFIERI